MSIFSRVAEIIHAKTNAVLNNMENTNDTLDLSYEKMVAALQEAKRHTADVVAERMSLEQQVTVTQKSMAQSDADAHLALSKGREDLARQALTAKAAATTKLQSLQTAHDAIQAQETKLNEYCVTMQQRIDAFRTEKEVMKAQNSAATAQIKVTESLTGIGNQMGDVGAALQRAKDRTDHMQAKAAALDSMVATGVLNDPLDSRTQVEKEMDTLRSGSTVDDELAAMKAAMASQPSVPGT
jgi:phage shock protein A